MQAIVAVSENCNNSTWNEKKSKYTTDKCFQIFSHDIFLLEILRIQRILRIFFLLCEKKHKNGIIISYRIS